MSREYETFKVGTFTLGSEVDITDPCYDRNSRGGMITACKPGEYTGYADISDEGEWGKRVARLSIYLNDEICHDLALYPIGDIGVDAGLAGFFNNKPNYRGDDWMRFLYESGVFKNKHEYNYDRDYYCISKGIFSESGFGDGCYDVLANVERSAFQIVFIDEDEEEE